MYITRSSEEPDREARHASKALPPSSRLAKRKRTTDDSTATIKIPKTKNSKILRPVFDQGFDLENGVNTAIGNLDSHLLADYVAQKTKMFDDNLTMVELEERRIPGTPFEPYEYYEVWTYIDRLLTSVQGKHFEIRLNGRGEGLFKAYPALLSISALRGTRPKVSRQPHRRTELRTPLS